LQLVGELLSRVMDLWFVLRTRLFAELWWRMHWMRVLPSVMCCQIRAVGVIKHNIISCCTVLWTQAFVTWEWVLRPRVMLSSGTKVIVQFGYSSLIFEIAT
jgi:hypothetical protein